MLHSDSLSLQFARTLLATRERATHPASLAAAARLLIDGLAVAALGSTEPGPGILANLALQATAGGPATLIGHAGTAAGPDAARANGAAMHVLDYEPMWNPANHSLSTTLPAVLALAEMRPGQFDGAAILRALLAGIEAQQRMRLASGQLEPGGLLFHPPGAVGAFGGAVGCGVLLGLDAPTLARAIGIAASRASGIQGNIGSMTKALHCGQSAMAGLESTLMAEQGFTSDPQALEGPRGYGRAFYGESFNAAHLLEERAALHALDPGPAFKFYPSQYGTHFVITAALEARRQQVDARSGDGPGGISRVRIVGPSMQYVDRPAPRSGLDGKFSFQYVAALALLDGRVNVASFTDARRFAADIEQLLPRIAIETDAARIGRFDRMSVDVIVDWADGRCTEARCEGPPGIWGRPCGEDILQAKAMDCLSPLLGERQAAGFLAQAQRFGELGPAEALACIARLRRDAAHGKALA